MRTPQPRQSGMLDHRYFKAVLALAVLLAALNFCRASGDDSEVQVVHAQPQSGEVLQEPTDHSGADRQLQRTRWEMFSIAVLLWSWPGTHGAPLPPCNLEEMARTDLPSEFVEISTYTLTASEMYPMGLGGWVINPGERYVYDDDKWLALVVDNIVPGDMIPEAIESDLLESQAYRPRTLSVPIDPFSRNDRKYRYYTVPGDSPYHHNWLDFIIVSDGPDQDTDIDWSEVAMGPERIQELSFDEATGVGDLVVWGSSVHYMNPESRTYDSEIRQGGSDWPYVVLEEDRSFFASQLAAILILYSAQQPGG